MYNHRAVMVDIYENRRERLRQIIQEQFAGNRTAFARALGFQRPQIIEYANGARTMGERVSHRIETGAQIADRLARYEGTTAQVARASIPTAHSRQAVPK